jgi:hypothetical protein
MAHAIAIRLYGVVRVRRGAALSSGIMVSPNDDQITNS